MSKNKLIIFILSLFCILTNGVLYANTLDVNASLPSWTYDKVIKIELIPTDLSAKTMFSFDPNGTPNDLYAYSWSILIKSSTPLIYFSFIDTNTESKIKQNDYILNFPNTIILWTWATFEDWITKNLKLTNVDSKEIDVSYWEIIKDSQKFIIPENTIIQPQQNFNIPYEFTGTGFISLFSPNEEKKDFLEIVEITEEVQIQTPQPKKIYYTPKKKPVVSEIPKENISQLNTEAITSSWITNPIENSWSNQKVSAEETSTSVIPSSQEKSVNTENTITETSSIIPTNQEVSVPKETSIIPATESNSTSTETPVKEIPTTVSVPEPASTENSTLADNLKLSAQESLWNNFSYKIILPFILWLALISWLAIQFYRRTKKVKARK